MRVLLNVDVWFVGVNNNDFKIGVGVMLIIFRVFMFDVGCDLCSVC